MAVYLLRTMYRFTDHAHSLYRTCGLALLLIQLNSWLAGMPPLQAGIWVQTEPTVLVLFVTGVLNALWLGVGLWRRWITPSSSLPPLLVWLLAWVAWQCIITALALIPERSWFGPPQTGDGTATSIATVLVALMAGPIWESAALRRPLMRVAGISLVVQCALHFYYPEVPGNLYMPERWVPAQWPEYLPFIGGYLWVAAFAGGFIKDRKSYAKMAVAMVALVADSYNRTAMCVFTLALVATAIPYLPAKWQTSFRPSRAWRLIMMAACVLPFTLVLVSPLIPWMDAKRDPTHIIGLFQNINAGIGSRLAMDQVALSTLQHEPDRLFIGGGWGNYTDDLFKYAIVDGVRAYKNGLHAPNWFLVEGSSHHSHNQPLEALLSLGVIGFVLWYALSLVMLATLPESLLWSCGSMIVAITVLAHFWFFLPQCFPYQGLFFAVMMAIGPQGRIRTPRNGWQYAACGLVAFLMLSSAMLHYHRMMHADRLHDASQLESYKDFTEAWAAEDLADGGERWTASAKFYSTIAYNKAAENKADDNIVGWYTNFMHVAQEAARSPVIGARTSSVALKMEYLLFEGFDPPIFLPLRHEATLAVEDDAMRLAHKAPFREDYTASFLANLPAYTHNDIHRQEQILNRLLAIAPDHRGALWLLGQMYLTTPGKEALGREMLVKAIATHVDRVYPVTDSEFKAVLQKLQ